MSRQSIRDVETIRAFATGLANWPSLSPATLLTLLTRKETEAAALPSRLRQQAEDILSGPRRGHREAEALREKVIRERIPLPATVGDLKNLLRGLSDETPLAGLPGAEDWGVGVLTSLGALPGPRFAPAGAGRSPSQRFNWGNSPEALGL